MHGAGSYPLDKLEAKRAVLQTIKASFRGTKQLSEFLGVKIKRVEKWITYPEISIPYHYAMMMAKEVKVNITLLCPEKDRIEANHIFNQMRFYCEQMETI